MSGSATRDWLLDKLLKLRQAMTEMKFDYEGRIGLMGLRHADEVEKLTTSLNAANNRITNVQTDRDELRERLLQVSTSKGYKVVFRGAFSPVDLEILAISHCNGNTVITVQRAL